MNQTRLPTLEEPTHVIALPSDRHSLCGVKDPLPVVALRFVDAHIRGHGMVVCRECRAVMDDVG
jgi:hypothetical protein